MTIYYPKSHYDKNHRSEVFPLLKPFVKGNDFTDAQRVAMYGVSDQDFTIVDDIQEAEVCILPMSWNYYLSTKQLPVALEFIEQAKVVGKKVWSFISGDHGVKHPEDDHVVVFRLGGYQSKHRSNHKGMPVFIGDYLLKNNLLDNYLPKTYSEQPLVGFCGQANGSKIQAGLDVIKKGCFNLKSLTGLSFYEPETLVPTSHLRAQLLQRLAHSEAIADQFILRAQYRAGVTHGKDRHQTTLEFYNNILESQYVLCVRGGGNFSVRFYETLMMGRIPVYIHTDGFLPLNDTIDWKHHVVWIEPDEQHKIAEKVLSFHSQLTAESLKVLSESNRKLWEDKLRMKGFFLTVSGIIQNN
ncbi:exostosin domain-containing protein [Aestuariibaculum marinum]|uniref:Exostosin family protein n=1 Tax=Aestuariibaculum marinum TaxID=2683592 RepID=A0A8J6PU76_9FLAO|nr:exostosin family protein [Aestuariibaculum marinum]MBD0823880.1 exostosin family protein [Aestuariibaculum marinum]